MESGRERIGTNRDLAYFVPETLNVGKYDCRYVVTDTKNGMKYFVDFNVNVVSNFSWGYYFLCEEPDQSAVLSYFSSKEGTTECLHATKIGDYALGKQPKAIIDHFGNISSLNDYFYSFNIITSQGDNPVIMTNNGAFMPSGLINDQSFIYEGDTFNPTDAVYMLTDAVYYFLMVKFILIIVVYYIGQLSMIKNITGAIRLLPILMYMFSMN